MSSSEVRVRLGRTPLRCRFVRPVAPAVGRGLRPGSRLECHRPIGLPATFLEVTRGTPSSLPRVASSRVGLGRRRLALARARWPLGSPNDGAPSGRVATFAAGLLLSRRRVVRLTLGRTRRSPLLRFCFPCNVSQPRCACPGLPAFRTIPLRRFAFPASFHPGHAGVASSLRFLSPSRSSFPSRIIKSPGRLGVAPRAIRARVLQVLCFVLRNRPAAGRCRGLAESHAVHHGTPIRQRSWGSICACCPSQFSSSLAGVDLFPGHAPTCR